MKVLVTGAAGFIGMHVARLLLARGDEVVGVDNLNDYYDPDLKAARLAQLHSLERFRFVRADVSDTVAMEGLFASGQFQRVVHLAAQSGVPASLADPLRDQFQLGHAAACCLARAIARAVYSATAMPEDIQPTWAGRFTTA